MLQRTNHKTYIRENPMFEHTTRKKAVEKYTTTTEESIETVVKKKRYMMASRKMSEYLDKLMF